MSLSLDDLKYFKIISETLNVTRASEIIGISQPALSYSLKRLESEFGAKLVVRLKSGVQLTKLGDEFKVRVNRLINEWESSQKIFSEEGKDSTGEFTIGIHPSVALGILDKTLLEFGKSYPRINFKLVHGISREMTQKVINWEVDFGIVVNPIRHPDLVIKELGKDVVTLFSTKKCAAKLIYDPSLTQSHFILKGFQKEKFKIEGYIHSGSLELVAKLASNSLGYGLLPTSVARNYKNLKALKNAPEFKDTICLVYRKEKHQSASSQKIISLIKSLKAYS